MSGGRIPIVAAFALSLAGCNNVVSMEPWFKTADAEGLPTFRDGLWVSAEPDCHIDEAKPVERWPDCADATYIRNGEWWPMRWGDTDQRGRHRRSFAGWMRDDSILASGDPLIGQVEMNPDDELTGKLAAEPGVTVTPSDDADAEASKRELTWRYLYYAARPTARDEAGRVTAIEVWGIRCGPLPEPVEPPKSPRGRRADDAELAEDPAYVTDQPFPGLTVVDNNCTAESVEALRRAAVLSERLDTRGSAHWVRDGWR